MTNPTKGQTGIRAMLLLLAINIALGVAFLVKVL